MTQFADTPTDTLVRYWNDGDGAISWRTELEAELRLRGYVPRATNPDDGRPRLRPGSEMVELELPPAPPLRGPSSSASTDEPGVRNVHGRRLYSAAWL